jgi:hypothetical protein
MSAHTKGPWTACDPDFFGDITINGPDGGLAIAAVYNGEMRWLAGQLEEHQANARLMAAAPDLLRALQDLDAWGNTPTDATNAASHTYRVWKQCADAIAAATGTEPDYSDLDDPGDIAAHEAALAELAEERDT